jgi:hypothetical protein
MCISSLVSAFLSSNSCLFSFSPLFPSLSVLSSSGAFCSFPLFSNLPASNSSQSQWYPILGAITTVVVSVVAVVLKSMAVVGAGDRIGMGAGMAVSDSKVVIGFESGVWAGAGIEVLTCNGDGIGIAAGAVVFNSKAVIGLVMV